MGYFLAILMVFALILADGVVSDFLGELYWAFPQFLVMVRLVAERGELLGERMIVYDLLAAAVVADSAAVDFDVAAVVAAGKR